MLGEQCCAPVKNDLARSGPDGRRNNGSGRKAPSWAHSETLGEAPTGPLALLGADVQAEIRDCLSLHSAPRRWCRARVDARHS